MYNVLYCGELIGTFSTIERVIETINQHTFEEITSRLPIEEQWNRKITLLCWQIIKID